MGLARAPKRGKRTKGISQRPRATDRSHPMADENINI